MSKKEEKSTLSIRITKEPKSDKVKAYVIQDKTIIFEQDVTNDFIGTVISLWNGSSQTVEGADKVYSILVQEIKKIKDSKIIKS